MREALRGFETGSAVRSSPTTLAEYLERWLDNVRPNLRQTAWAGYRRDVANIIEKLGKVRLQDLTPLQSETAYTLLRSRKGAPAARSRRNQSRTSTQHCDARSATRSAWDHEIDMGIDR
jgi:hypothetical protein